MTAVRVGLLTETFYPVVGGGETQARLLASGLTDEGYSVLVVTRRSARQLRKREIVDSVTVHRVPPVGSGRPRKWGLLLTALPALLRLRREYDLLFVSGYRILGVPGVLAARALGKACILKADSPGEMSGEYHAGGLARLRLTPSSPPVRLMLALRNRLFLKADGFVALSSEVRDELLGCGVGADSIHPIPNCVDATRFRGASDPEKRGLRRRLELPESAAIVVYTGRLVSYKGLPLLLRAWRHVLARHPEALLVLVGAGGLDMDDCEDELKAYARDNGLSTSVRFTGNVENVEDYLRAGDLFAFPTENEAFGISLIEAMACEVPVVSTPVGGIKDVLEHEKNGLLVDVGDEAGLAAALDRVLSDPDLAARLGKTARETVLGRYSAQTVVPRYARLFREVIAARDAPTVA